MGGGSFDMSNFMPIKQAKKQFELETYEKQQTKDLEEERLRILRRRGMGGGMLTQDLQSTLG